MKQWSFVNQRKELQKWRFENDGAMISRSDFAPLLETTIDSMENKESSLINGFRKCGLHPFDANAIDYKSFPSPDGSSTGNSAEPAPILPEENEELQDKAVSLPESEDPSKWLRILNEKLLPSQLAQFQEHRNKLLWSGPAEDTNLFYLWRNTMDEIEGPPEFMFIDSPFVTISDAGNQFNSDSVVIPEDATNSHDSK